MQMTGTDDDSEDTMTELPNDWFVEHDGQRLVLDPEKVRAALPRNEDSMAKAIKVSELTLVGRCFHIFDDQGCVQYQGMVRGNLGDGNYLVQYFEWMVGEASTMAVVPIAKMLEPEARRGSGAWQFYEDAEHMNFWYEHRANKRS